MKNYRNRRLEKARRRLDQKPLVDKNGTPVTQDDHDLIHQQGSAPIVDEDCPLLWKFDERLERDEEKGAATHAAHFNRAITIAEHRTQPSPNNGANAVHGIPFESILHDPDAVDAVIEWIDDRTCINDERISKWYRYDFKRALYWFGVLVTEGDTPQFILDIDHSQPKDPNPSPDPDTILTWHDHILPMADHPDTKCRDAAMYTLQWDSMVRPTELYDCVVGNVVVRDGVLRLAVKDTKTFNRAPPIGASIPYLELWMAKLEKMTPDANELPSLPYRIPPETPLWTQLNEPVKISYGHYYDRFIDGGRRADIQLPTNPKHVQKSRASLIAASPDIAGRALRKRAGWTRNSQVLKHYIAEFDHRYEQQIADYDGLDINLVEKPPKAAAVVCDRCEKWTHRHFDKCIYCNESVGDDLKETDDILEEVQSEEKLKQEFVEEFRADFQEAEISLKSIEVAMRIVEVAAQKPELSFESVALVLARDYDINSGHIYDLLSDGKGIKELRCAVSRHISD